MTHPPDTQRHAEAGAEPGNGSLSPDAPTAGDIAARAASLLPAQLIQPGEVIILLLKPHPLYIVLAPLRVLTILVLTTLLGVLIADNLGEPETRQQIVVAGMVLIAARLGWQALEWLSRVYVLTDQRVVAVAGVLRIRVFETPLRNLTHSELLFSIRERVFALGSLGFYTAGTDRAEAYWLMVARPLEVHAKVVETLRRYRR